MLVVAWFIILLVCGLISNWMLNVIGLLSCILIVLTDQDTNEVFQTVF